MAQTTHLFILKQLLSDDFQLTVSTYSCLAWKSWSADLAGLWDPSQPPKKVPIVTSHDQPPSNCSQVLSAPKLKSGKPGNGTALTETEPEKWLHVPFHSFPFHYCSPSRSAQRDWRHRCIENCLVMVLELFACKYVNHKW